MDTEKFFELYNQGLDDLEISSKLGCSERCIKNFRKEKGILS